MLVPLVSVALVLISAATRRTLILVLVTVTQSPSPLVNAQVEFVLISSSPRKRHSILVPRVAIDDVLRRCWNGKDIDPADHTVSPTTPLSVSNLTFFIVCSHTWRTPLVPSAVMVSSSTSELVQPRIRLACPYFSSRSCGIPVNSTASGLLVVVNPSCSPMVTRQYFSVDPHLNEIQRD